MCKNNSIICDENLIRILSQFYKYIDYAKGVPILLSRKSASFKSIYPIN